MISFRCSGRVGTFFSHFSHFLNINFYKFCIKNKNGKKRFCGRSIGHNIGHPLDRKQTFFYGQPDKKKKLPTLCPSGWVYLSPELRVEGLRTPRGAHLATRAQLPGVQVGEDLGHNLRGQVEGRRLPSVFFLTSIYIHIFLLLLGAC